MNITRQNYEEWLLLYVDNELSLAERIIVDDFLAANPDLQQELEMLQQSTFRPDEEIVFPGKEILLKNNNEFVITPANCEQYFVLYADDELSNQQKASVEEFVYHHPQFQAAFELIQQAKLTPDQSIVFPDKKLLYRSEKSRRVVMMRWYKIAAAAVLVLLIGGVSYQWLSKKDDNTEMASRNGQQTPQSSGIAANDSAADHEPGKTPADESNAEAQPLSTVTEKSQVEKVGVKNDVAKKAPANAAAQRPQITIPSPVTMPDNRTASGFPVNHDMANNDHGKKVSDPGNTTIASNVTPTEALKGTEKLNTEKINVKSPGNTALNNSDMAAIADHSYDLLEEEDIEIQPADKKNKMRGILRRVSRVFDKATNADASDNRKGNIRIANFEIALK
ncbi:hypothetical protein [Pseudobacter ginsenosidimutans]|uniref:Uncharacterized protein n=1 Tax=Pseudobacter ginsenosidimutans TaxID=661488 RepID=A0A4Q7MVS8_9BACT|nr:hypothetical protein [Pseudobacter ginsenosidimutans]QEC41111.1 hypothetical protein FSB84_05155 [Pseudobacter ginsenosidimutans]RZS72129.1 hypothetical protein EV199_4044 [Pseudobacter ginsenosidimutans]